MSQFLGQLIPPPVRRKEDDEQLKLLSIFHYCMGGFVCLMACFPLVHVATGIAMLLAPNLLKGSNGSVPLPNGVEPGGAPPEALGWILIIAGAIFFLIGQAVGVVIIMAGRSLARRRRYLFVLIVAWLQCAIFPIGTALGIFTIIVLLRQSVKAQFKPLAYPAEPDYRG